MQLITEFKYVLWQHIYGVIKLCLANRFKISKRTLLTKGCLIKVNLTWVDQGYILKKAQRKQKQLISRHLRGYNNCGDE